jgi:hypothetical protein
VYPRLANRHTLISVRVPAILLAITLALLVPGAAQVPVTVTVDGSAPLASFDPAHALGAAIDGHEKGDTKRMFSLRAARAMRSAGFHSLSYRLRTELAGEVWHWNPHGRWSDAAHRQGYWISSADSRTPIRVSYGYRLPRRGNTHDQANDDGYSRLDDGNDATFWKSNPYLDSHFTHEAKDAHPQWIVIDTGGAAVNVLKIAWAQPFAVDYSVEYSNDADGPEDFATDTLWTAFPAGAVHGGTGGNAELTLAAAPIAAKYVRILMTQSSMTSPAASRDIRDSLGYAVCEIRLGTLDAAGAFQDVIKHGRSNKDQTTMYVSSTDPWHRAMDRDERIEQPGLDLIFRRGLADQQPAMIPSGVLYDTPDNAAAELRFLRSRGYRVGRLELGEEPDEQWGAAEDYGALYLEWVDALHAIDPALQVGGPSLVADSSTPDPDSHSPFVPRLFAYLNARRRLKDFSFFSFEWYPFDDVCDPIAPQLAQAADLLAGTVDRFHQLGVPAGMPMAITEYGYSAYGAEAEVDVPGALIDADIIGRFLTSGGDQAFLYGWEPGEPLSDRPCTTGNNMMFTEGDLTPTATYHSSRLLTMRWLETQGKHDIYRAHADARDADGNELVRAYPVRRPDGRWSVMVVNMDPEHSYTATFRLASGEALKAAQVWQFSRAQYQWHQEGADGYPDPSLPAVRVAAAADGTLALPPWSLTVVLAQ